jgi:rhodanese-related sulfurtransferase
MQSYIFPILLITFFGYRLYRNYKLKKILPDLINDGAIIIDVRTVSEFKSVANPKSINIPLDQINSNSNNIDKNKFIILCCASGTRSSIAFGILKKNGFKNVLNAGAWTNTII